MEAFIRPLWGLAPYWMNHETKDELKDVYRKKILKGMNPKDSFIGEILTIMTNIS